jgi:hypothetical protein
LDDLVDALQMIMYGYMNNGMALFYCQPSRFGSFQRCVGCLGLPIDLKPESTLGLLVL